MGKTPWGPPGRIYLFVLFVAHVPSGPLREPKGFGGFTLVYGVFSVGEAQKNQMSSKKDNLM